MSRASDPLVATARTDGTEQRFASRLGTHFATTTRETLSDAVPIGLGMLADHADIDVAFAALLDRERVSEVWEWCREGLRSAPPQVGWPIERAFGAAGQILRMGIAIPVADVGQLSLDEEIRTRFEVADTRSILLVPVRRQDELVGVVGFLTTGRHREWPPDSVRTLDNFGNLMLAAVLRIRYQADLALTDARMRRLADLIPEALVFVGNDGFITWVSRAAASVLATPPERLLGRPPDDLVRRGDRSALREAVTRAWRGLDSLPLSCRVPTPEGERWCEVSASYPQDGPQAPGAAPVEVLLSFRDVHASRLEAQRLSRQANTDPLTGALNRSGLTEALDDLGSDFVAVAFCDLDGFKQVNDVHGHRMGDAVLADVADRLRAASRSMDLLARLGGDEFLVLARDVRDAAGAAAVAEQLVRAVADPDGWMTLTLQDRMYRLKLSVSVGVALSGPGDAFEDVLRHADAAMYESKRLGKNRWQVHA